MIVQFDLLGHGYRNTLTSNLLVPPSINKLSLGHGPTPHVTLTITVHVHMNVLVKLVQS
jgi:hypothetical protein